MTDVAGILVTEFIGPTHITDLPAVLMHMGVDSPVTSGLISLSSDYRLFCSLKHSKLYKEWP